LGCFLELAEPCIETGVEQLAAGGCDRIVVLPLLLLAAGHAKQEIPAAIANATREHPGIEFVLASHLGCDERMLRLSALRFKEAARDEEPVDPQDTLWLMVGRGSRDAEQIAELERFVECRLRHTPVGQLRIAYLAMAEPRLDEALTEVAELRYHRVVVQPHLLFHGELLETVTAQVADMRLRWPQQQWLVAPHLGVADLLVQAMLERFWEVDLVRT
jgi:sirohydrochlorin ferrochelatase